MRRFSEWMKEVDKLQKNFKQVSLCEIRETICVENKTITIILGKEPHIEVNGGPSGLRYLRPLYTHNKEEFDSLLESLKSSAKEVAEATDIILAAVTDEAIPGAVISRMKGEQVNGGSAELVQSMVTKKLGELYDMVKETKPPFERFTIDLPVAGDKLGIDYKGPGDSITVSWRNLAVYTYGTKTEPVEDCLKFLASFNSIKAKLQAFCNIIRETKKLGKRK